LEKKKIRKMVYIFRQQHRSFKKIKSPVNPSHIS
jgi:hypothetical protein